MAGVAQIVNTLGHGGVENLSSRIASALAEARLGSHLVVTAKGPVELAYAMAPSVEVWSAERHFALDLGALRRMGRYFDSAGVDVVHSHNWVAAYHAQGAAFFARQRPVHVFHCHSGTRQSAHGPLDQWVLRGVDAVVCVTEAIRGSFEAQLGLPEDRCLLIPNGVEVYPLA
ncbi:MAG: glycosyltransferase family 4 protein, partial [Myxococcota bacterium]